MGFAEGDGVDGDRLFVQRLSLGELAHAIVEMGEVVQAYGVVRVVHAEQLLGYGDACWYSGSAWA